MTRAQGLLPFCAHSQKGQSNMKKLCAALALVSTMALSASALAVDFNCTPTTVGVFTNRIHVQCTTSTTDGSSVISFFAVPVTDAQFANRFLTMASTALAAGRS